LKLEKLEPLSIWQIVCRALRIYKENFLRFIAIVAIVPSVNLLLRILVVLSGIEPFPRRGLSP